MPQTHASLFLLWGLYEMDLCDFHAPQIYSEYCEVCVCVWVREQH